MRPRCRVSTCWRAGLAAWLACAVASAQAPIPSDRAATPGALYDGFARTSLYVPVRDGTRLAIDIFRPTRAGVLASQRLPVVWMHTPYNRRTTAQGTATAEKYPGYALELVKYGYNVAVADFRGLYASFGQNRGYNRGEWVAASRMDAYDITEWLARQPWSTGKVGMWGCSATGGSQLEAATTLPPSLKAIMPMSAEFDAYPFLVMGGVQFPEPWKETTSQQANAARDAKAAPVDGADAPRLLAEAIATHRDNVESPGRLPYRDSHSSSLGLDWWQVSSPSTYLDALERGDFGVYLTANWDEAGTKPGAFQLFVNLPASRAKLLVGPKQHCGWSEVQDETGFSIVSEERHFFDHWLKGIDNQVMDSRVTYYTYNAAKGKEWRTAQSWPPAPQQPTPFFLTRSLLSRQSAPSASADRVSMSPTGKSTVIKIEPQQGGISYQTEPLAVDTEVTGDPVAHLWIRTNAQDTLAMVWIDDVAPDGSTRSYQMLGRLLASDRALARSPYDNLGLPWHSFLKKDAMPLRPGKPSELVFGLLPMSYLFKAGHRIRATVTFTDPQGRVEGMPPVELLSGGTQSSYLVLPLVPLRSGRAYASGEGTPP